MSPNLMITIPLLLAAALALVGISATILLREARRADLEARVVRVVTGRVVEDGPSAGLVGFLHSLGERVRRGSRFYSGKDLDYLRGLLLAAGLNPTRVLPILIGGKFAVMVLLPVASALLASLIVQTVTTRIAVIGIGLILGILGPEWILGALRRPYVAALQKGTPDALDLLVVCSEAGMGLESALERVSQEMAHSNRPMSLALAGLLDDLRVLPDRRAAFIRFGSRTGIEGLQRLSVMLGQSLQYGTPLSQALRAVAAELRRERMNKLEEKAVKLPSLLIFPMIFFIMPSLYVVLLGTSFLRLYDALAAFTTHLPQ